MADDAEARLHALRWDRAQRAVRLLLSELDDRAELLERSTERHQAIARIAEELRTRLLVHLDDLGDAPAAATARDLLGLAEDVVGLSGATPPGSRTEVSEFTAADLFATLDLLFRPLLAASPELTLVFEAKPLPPLRTDEGKLAHVLRNFLAVVLRYTRRGQVSVVAEPAGADEVAFTVSDTRVASDPEPDDVRRARIAAGSLRLDVVRGLTAALGGQAALEHSVAGTSTFRLVVPRVMSRPAPSEPAPVPATDEPLVLVVEDDEATLYLYERYLRDSGFALLPARTLDDARRALGRRPAAVLLDLLLEQEATWSFLAELRRSPATRALPVMMATVLEGAGQALDAGVDEFHTKPLAREQLLDALTRLTGRSYRGTVLVVDGTGDGAARLRAALRETGYRVVASRSAAEARARIAAEAPDLVVAGPGVPAAELGPACEVLEIADGGGLEAVVERLRRPAV